VLARQPAKGDTVELGGYRIEVEGAKGFRITSLLFQPLGQPEAPDIPSGEPETSGSSK
jgi:hypothetical protein